MLFRRNIYANARWPRVLYTGDKANHPLPPPLFELKCNEWYSNNKPVIYINAEQAINICIIIGKTRAGG